MYSDGKRYGDPYSHVRFHASGYGKSCSHNSSDNDVRRLSASQRHRMWQQASLGAGGGARVVVGARISKSGGATPQPGDLQGLSAPVAPGSTEAAALAIEISQPVP